MQRFVVVAASVASAGCNDAITLHITSDRPVPQAIDSICVGVADPAPTGGHFGRQYRLQGELGTLPQTLRVEAGGAASAWAWVRADHGGVPATGAAHAIDFGGDVTLDLPACVKGASGIPHAVGSPTGPGNAHLAVSRGQGGTLVVAIAPGSATVLDATPMLTALSAPPPPAGNIVGVIAADLDGDCDDDIVIATDGGAPELWRREGASFIDAGAIGMGTVAAIAAGDVDRDGHIDLVTGGGGSLQLWLNDGSGTFTRDAAKLSAGGRVIAVSALALGDLDSDGNPDLVVGQAGQTLVAWHGQPDGSFMADDAIVAAIPLDVEHLAVVDADSDFAPDLVVAVRGGPMRLYSNRGDGRLEDRSYNRLPQPAPVAHAVAIGGWDDGCEPDAVIASDAGGPLLRGQPTGTFANDDGAVPAATDAVLADIDDDGDLDAIVATSQGVVWLAR